MAKTLRFQLEPQFSSSWTQRFAYHFQKGIHHIPVLRDDGAEDDESQEDEVKVSLLDTPVPKDGRLLVPLQPQKLLCQQNLKSPLLQLPTELLIHLMLFLPYSSLYMVRQTCQVLRNLTNDVEFADFQWYILQHEAVGCYTSVATCDQLRDIKRIFLRRSLCVPCIKLFDSGELEERMKKLWQRIYCRGCKTEHPELLFRQGGRGYNICVGLQGDLALCNHVKVSGKVKPSGKTIIKKDEEAQAQ
ncbi:hypothetical protein FCULG_00007075 [Fusarium culmorum]|uniref:F-box domain-containing protein n=1 Tax=Fusarium culmorum TaxID=5516 RepID=A0A2T4GVC0_FUSCU|nr:hypothetical protein FCULG_00007075 [Fusarium culmorum]